MTDKPRLGPWLRRYERDEEVEKERRKELAIGIAVGVASLGALIGLVWLFIRWPYLVLGALVSAWVVGFLFFVVKHRRARFQDRMLYEGHAFHEIRRALRGRGSRED